jgi:glycosyltransferase involved in cell wall biosynthesis
MSPVKLSIITTTFNAEPFIAGCLENVAEQNCPGVEHLIFDGASTDRTAAILARLAPAFPHVRWVSEPDRGQAHAMNKGIAAARGSILGFLNVDDYYKPGVLKRVLEIFRNVKEPAFVVGNCDIMQRNGKIVRQSRPVGLTYEAMMAGEVIPPLNPVSYFYRKSLHDLAGLYDENEHAFMDMDALARLLEGASIHYFDESWGVFRMHSVSKTGIRNKSKDQLVAIDEVLRDRIDRLPAWRREVIWQRRRVVEARLSRH